MELIAHITNHEFPTVLVALASGIMIGTALTWVTMRFWGRGR
ncbi:hypothetical protein Enr8_48640 [Blastopirellula retiformator]|uniref:Uncharacterized protein n=1 Tax=Blastopirellula retiformator TaxID=2527970 RepID=A0A5C5UTV9_9BACT|nr:hypothetical protein Enr8_48640 [Blastopirellula retiformator]